MGSEQFKKEALARMEGRLGEHHAGSVRLESAEAKAERIMGEELKRLGWKAAELGRRHKSDPCKLALAARLRRETTLPIKWIAARLRLGTWKSASSRLHVWRKTHEKESEKAML